MGMTLKEAIEGKEYIIKDIVTDDEELDAFLFSLGCYSDEPITVVSHLKGTGVAVVVFIAVFDRGAVAAS